MVELVAMVDVEEGVDEEVATVVMDEEEEEEAAAMDHPFAVVWARRRLPWGRPWRWKKETRNKTSRPQLVVGSVGGTARSRRYLSLV
eukprot:scaffold58986_cov95-Attheya_sp.AAC.2